MFVSKSTQESDHIQQKGYQIAIRLDKNKELNHDF